MLRTPGRRRTSAVAALGAATAMLVATLSTPGAQADLESPDEPGIVTAPGLEDVDTRTARIAPTSAQLSAVRGLGATARWNDFGTPQSLINHGGYLGGNGSADAVRAARQWLFSNRGLFKLSWTQVNNLEVVNDQRMAQSNAHAVLFRQKFGGLPAAVDGMVTVSVKNGKIAYVSSSIAPTTRTPGSASLTAVQAWLKAASDVGRVVAPDAVENLRRERDWTVFDVRGFAQPQRARLRSLPAPNGSVRAVWEANVLDNHAEVSMAYTSFVDAQNGTVIVRHNQVENSEFTDTFMGSISATACGPQHPFTVDAETETIIYSASEDVPANDITIKLIDPNGETVSAQDTGFSPEVQVYNGPIIAGEYKVEVCPFDPPLEDFIPPGSYTGTFTASEQQASGIAYPPKWKYFLANPPLNFSETHTQDNRKVGCWESVVGGAPVADCDNPPSDLINLAARGPWDYNFRTNTPTFTTEGNAAITAEAWVNPPTILFGNLTPGGFGQRPFSTDREYIQPFNDVWNNEKCNPATLTPGGNDILPSVTHLFSNHNRVHDFSYFLGFTEANYNLQDSNFGNQGAERDPEIGNVQSGAITGGPPLFGGRDNANQITLQDGIPGITNQYLFQPIAGAFYAPCVDGDYDMSVVGHEYTHAISNRMVGGPDSGLNGFQGRSMGESWSDQVATEYLIEHSYDQGVSPYVIGAYVTGNKQTGIRNYRLDNNPLQYGDLGYDISGPEVHSDGEPWSAVNIDIQQALQRKYNGQFPASDKGLQRRCSQGVTTLEPPQAPLPAQQCPGNRRWIQLMFDSFLMQQPDTSMLDARDAMLAADVMRFNGANQGLLWYEFANNGFGQFAQTDTTEDDNPKPDYNSPLGPEGTLRIDAQAVDQPGRPHVNGELYVGRYHARVTPVADTNNNDGALPNNIKLVPGTYTLLFRADGYGVSRFNVQINANQTTDRVLHLSTNLASLSNGATATGSAGVVNAKRLIDDTEETNFAALNQTAGVQNTKPYVTVDLTGGKQMVRSVKVSAMLRPASTAQEEDEPQPDMGTQSRFTALRKFAIETCTQSATSDCVNSPSSGVPGSSYTRKFTSADDAFPSILPRPLVPDLLWQRFDVPDTEATHVRLIVLENQCTGAPDYQGDQDNDPLNNTDCITGSSRETQARAAELQVFSFDESTRPPGDPVVASTMTAPATVKPGDRIQYTISYTNLGPEPSAGATITDQLPDGVWFNFASDGATYNSTTRTVKWDLGTVPVNFTGTVKLTVRVPSSTPVGTVLLNQSQFAGQLTFSPPAAAVTTVGLL
jgi:uncharacterized repeat protein (TIGR01451 family)